MYLDRNLGLRLSLSEATLLFDLSLYLDRILAQRKAKSKVKVAIVLYTDSRTNQKCNATLSNTFITLTQGKGSSNNAQLSEEGAH